MQTIGERLEEARKKKGISIREAAEATKIRGDYLQKFESNHFDIGLTEIYTRGFLRTYANFLKLPADRILNDYAALGRGDVRPRQPSREVYGRMDISVASNEEGGEAKSSTTETPPPPEPSHANRGPARSRAGTSLPSGPDPAVVFKYIKWGGIAVIGLLAILLIWILVGGSKPTTVANTPPSTGTNTATPTRPPSIDLVGVRPVQVRVTRANPDRTDGELIWQGVLSPGQTRTIQRTSSIFIEASPPENLEIDLNGRRTNWGQALANSGTNKGEIPLPPPAP